MAAELRLELLGGVHITHNGVARSTFVSSKAPALLCYLAVTGRPQFRATLAGLLWSDLPEDMARRNLRVVLANLRQTLASHVIITRDTIAFDRAAPYWLDVEQVEAALQPDAPVTVERLQAAGALYTGDFLDGFYVRDAPLFEEWASAQRERLRHRVVHALHDVVDLHTTHAAYAAGIDAATRLLQLDPWREETHRQLMRLLALSGQPSAALAQYAACRRVLDAELGAEASPETTRLYEQIRDGMIAPVKADVVVGAARAMHPQRRPTLPPPSTPLIGRELELAHIAQRLVDPACRLLTLTGPGGTGKTRLALHAAAAHMARFPDGVVWVPLVSAGSRDQIITGIAEALDVALGGQHDPLTQLLEELRPQRLLLVLDNLEHLPTAPGVIHAMVEAAPQVVVLATSRERLNLQAEWLLDVHGLPYPRAIRERRDGIQDPARVEGYGAVQLFVQRATQVQPRWTLADAPMSAVLRICQLVQGIPLAIELAAAWVRTVSCTDIADEIGQNLDFLRTTLWDVPARHRSIRAVFDYSWQLLPTEQRAALAQLAVFRGGFATDAARAVAGVDRRQLVALIDSSLLQQDAGGRFVVHELVRQFAGEQLSRDGQLDAQARGRHAAYFVAMVETAAPASQEHLQSDGLAQVQLEYDNQLAALEWMLQRDDSGGSLRLCVALAHYWDLRGQLSEGRQWLRTALALADHETTVVRADALELAGRFAAEQGDWSEAVAVLDQAVRVSRTLGDTRRMARLLRTQGWVALMRGEYAGATGLLAESVAVYRTLGDKDGVARVLGLQGQAAYEQGAFAEAVPLLTESLMRSRALDDQIDAAWSVNKLGLIALYQSNWSEAERLLGESLAMFESLAYQRGIAWVRGSLGCVRVGQGAYTRAVELFEDSLARYRELGETRNIAFSLERLAIVASAQGQLGRAARLFGAAQTLRHEHGVPLPPVDQQYYRQYHPRLHATPDTPDGVAAAWAEGAAFSTQQAIAYALRQGSGAEGSTIHG